MSTDNTGIQNIREQFCQKLEQRGKMCEWHTTRLARDGAHRLVLYTDEELLQNKPLQSEEERKQNRHIYVCLKKSTLI